MRLTHRLLVLTALAAIGGCHRPAHTPAPLAAVALGEGAKQAPGLWAQTVSDHAGVHVTRYCLDAAAGASLASFDSQLNGRCSRRDMAQAADGSWHFATDCDMGEGGKVTTEGLVRGDFKTHYVVEAQSHTVKAADPAANGADRVTADVARVGDCPADMKPGDVVLPDGSRSRLEVLAGHA
jgi:hypothetical protein